MFVFAIGKDYEGIGITIYKQVDQSLKKIPEKLKIGRKLKDRNPIGEELWKTK